MPTLASRPHTSPPCIHPIYPRHTFTPKTTPRPHISTLSPPHFHTYRHVERVKWYAPHIRHIVVDLELRPGGGGAESEGPVAGGGGESEGLAAAAPPPQHHSGRPSRPLPGQADSLPRSPADGGAGTTSSASSAAEASPPWFRLPFDQLSRVAVVDCCAYRNAASSQSAADDGSHKPGRPSLPSSYVPPASSSDGPAAACPAPAWQWFEAEVSQRREPVLLTGLDLGPAVHTWTPEYIAGLPSSRTTQVTRGSCCSPPPRPWISRRHCTALHRTAQPSVRQEALDHLPRPPLLFHLPTFPLLQVSAHVTSAPSGGLSFHPRKAPSLTPLPPRPSSRSASTSPQPPPAASALWTRTSPSRS